MLHHIALGAINIEQVAAFYQEKFDLKEIARHLDEAGALRSIWLRLGPGCVLMVERSDTPPRRVEGIGAGPFLLAFHAPDQETREAWCSALERAGHPIETKTHFTSYTRDPEGNRVALSCYPLPQEP